MDLFTFMSQNPELTFMLALLGSFTVVRLFTVAMVGRPQARQKTPEHAPHVHGE